MPDDPLPLPPLSAPRFGIRTLLLLMALVGLLLACYRWFGGLATSMIALLAATIVAHVAGNALGSRLRQGSATARVFQPRVDLSRATAPPMVSVASTRLRERARLMQPLVLAAVVGATLGGGLGFWFFGLHDTARATWTDTMLGTLAFALLGGMVAAVATGFSVVMWTAWRAAVAHHDAHDTGRSRSDAHRFKQS